MDSVIKAAAVYFVLWLVIRASGRRTLGQLTVFDLILFLIIGGVTARALMGQDYSLTTAFLVIVTFVLIDVLLSFVERDVPCSGGEVGVALAWDLPPARCSEPRSPLRTTAPAITAMAIPPTAMATAIPPTDMPTAIPPTDMPTAIPPTAMPTRRLTPTLMPIPDIVGRPSGAAGELQP
jgi:hypothetical protein